MVLTMTASSLMGSKVTAPQRTAAPRRAAAPVSATLRSDVARFAKAAGVSAASLALALSAQAAEVKLGQDGGGLAFDPPTITIKAGESVTWVNNAGFPHNVMFDEDDVPSGVSVDALSHEDYLNAKGEKVTTTFKTAGTYGYYCEPHQGAGMVGKVVVQ